MPTYQLRTPPRGPHIVKNESQFGADVRVSCKDHGCAVPWHRPHEGRGLA
jgi:hypothetical protein